MSEAKSFNGYYLEPIFNAYVQRLVTALASVDKYSLQRVFEVLVKCRKEGNTVFVAGNGGSAASASHFCCDLSYGGRTSLENNLKTSSLVDNVALLTALSNDFSYEDAVALEVERLISNRDALILITASGNSDNVINAAKVARKKGATVIVFSGFDGGKIAEFSDISVHVPTEKGDYGVVEDVHMMLNHILVLALRDS